MLTKVSIVNELSYRQFEEMEAMEKRYYAAEFITPASEAWKWYQEYPLSTIAAQVDEKIIGFVNLFPVKSEIYLLLRAGRFNDSLLRVEHLDNGRGELCYMFLSCLVVAQEFRGLGVTNMLLNAAIKPYLGFPCVSVITDNVTEEGVRFSENFGFSFICESDHHSKIYEQSWVNFVAQIKNLP